MVCISTEAGTIQAYPAGKFGLMRGWGEFRSLLRAVKGEGIPAKVVREDDGKSPCVTVLFTRPALVGGVSTMHLCFRFIP